MCRLNSDKIVELRRENGVSQKKLGDAIGVHHTTISDYELAKLNVTDERAKQIADYFGVPVSEIIDESGESMGRNLILHRSGTRRYLKPEEVEAMFNARRKELGITEEREMETVNNALRSKIIIGDQVTMQIKPEWIHYPEWQRDLNMNHALSMSGENYKAHKWDNISVFIDNGKLYVSDGGHRAVSCLVGKREWLTAKLIDSDDAKQYALESFVEQSQDRYKMTQAHIWRAAITMQIPQYLEMRKICVRNGIQIMPDKFRLDNPKGKLNPSHRVLKMCMDNQYTFERTLRLINNLEWYGASRNPVYNHKIIAMLTKLYAKYITEASLFEEAMLTIYKGAANFEKNILNRNINDVFDMISKHVDAFIDMKHKQAL